MNINSNINFKEAFSTFTAKAKIAEKLKNPLIAASLVGATAMPANSAQIKQNIVDIHAAPNPNSVLVNKEKANDSLELARVKGPRISPEHKELRNKFIELLKEIKDDGKNIPFSKINLNGLKIRDDQSGLNVTLNGVEGKLSKTYEVSTKIDENGRVRQTESGIKFIPNKDENTKNENINEISLTKTVLSKSDNSGTFTAGKFIKIDGKSFGTALDVDEYTKFSTKVENPKTESSK
jgi:hypothetical protein